MKKDFYTHSKKGLIDLYEESKPLIIDWNNKHTVLPESFTYHEIYTRQDYIRGDCKVKPGDIVVDCGGNIGIFTSFAFDNGAYRVLSFEPFFDNFELNKKNNHNAEVFNLAVSDKSDETIELLYTPTGNGGHTTILSEMESQEGHFEHKNIYIKTITLDDIISRNFIDHIDFLKVDTEGAELLIFEGLSNENLSKIRCIALEYHHNVFNYDEDIYNKFQERFLKLGFNTYTWTLDKFTRMLYVSRGDIFNKNK